MTEARNRTARPVDPLRGSLRLFRRWRSSLISEIDQPSVIERVRSESGTTPRYIFMTCMSAGIAILGMLLSSPAVVIGAMLLSPLMGPIIGAGFALATGDFDWMRKAARALAIGIVLAILFCALIVYASPLKTITEEIAARTRPNLFDLGIALFSALAGAYAMIWGREGTIVGVAIATALMPPLAAIGFGLATLNWTVFGGASFLFLTNLMTIALTAAAMARFFGFSTDLTPRGTLMQSLGMIGVFVLLAVPLGLTLRQIAWESTATRTANSVIGEQFASDARVSQLDFEFDSNPIRVTASVLTPEIIDNAEQRAERALERELERPVRIEITQYRVGTAGNAASAELALARMREQQQAIEQATGELTQRLVLVAGVRPSAVTVDREARRAIVRARPLPSAELETYRVLEQRVAANDPDWRIELVPPARPLPEIALQPASDEDGAPMRPTEEGARALALAIWASTRIGTPVGVAGQSEAAEAVSALLRARGIETVVQPDRSLPADRVELRWLAPDEAAPEADPPLD